MSLGIMLPSAAFVNAPKDVNRAGETGADKSINRRDLCQGVTRSRSLPIGVPSLRDSILSGSIPGTTVPGFHIPRLWRWDRTDIATLLGFIVMSFRVASATRNLLGLC
jgi:hypothetical protein